MDSGGIKIDAAGLTSWQLKALLAVEDPSFFTHKGVDLKTPGAGITTITQGLVKILYFKKFKPGIAKFKQTIIARFVLDRMVCKKEQLTLFINLIYLGRSGDKPVYGFYNAAAVYYGKEVAALTEDEYLSIAAMIIAPANFSLTGRPDANRERTRRLKALVSGKYRPKGLMDLYYGPLDDTAAKGLAPASYFPGIYE